MSESNAWSVHHSSPTVPLDDREAGSGGNAALVVLVAGHLDVALVTPGGAPAVLHQPVLLPHLAAIAHHQNAVVQLGAAALRLIVHTCGKTWVQSVHAYSNHHQNAVVQLGAAALRLIVHTCSKTWVQSVHAYSNHHQNTVVQLGAAALRLIVHPCSKTWAQSVQVYSKKPITRMLWSSCTHAHHTHQTPSTGLQHPSFNHCHI